MYRGRRESLHNVFGVCICSRVRMIHGDGPIVMSFLYGIKQANGDIHGGGSIGVGSGGMIKMISLYCMSQV